MDSFGLDFSDSEYGAAANYFENDN